MAAREVNNQSALLPHSYFVALTRQEIKDFCARVIKQVGGSPDEDLPLLPEYGIIGSGILYCREYGTRSFVKISRGQKAWLIDDEKDELNKVLIYTSCGKIVMIDYDELIYTECD